MLVEVKIHTASLVRVATLQYLPKSKVQISFDQRILLLGVSSADNTYECTKRCMYRDIQCSIICNSKTKND